MAVLELYQENLLPSHTNPPRLRTFLLNIMHKNVLHSLRHDQLCIQAPAKREYQIETMHALAAGYCIKHLDTI